MFGFKNKEREPFVFAPSDPTPPGLPSSELFPNTNFYTTMTSEYFQLICAEIVELKRRLAELEAKAK